MVSYPVLSHCSVERDNQEKHFPMRAGGQRTKYRTGGQDSRLDALNDEGGRMSIDFVRYLALQRAT